MSSTHCLIIHGLGGSPQENWFPWLKGSLEQASWSVDVPALPRSDHPVVAEWNRVLAPAVAEGSVIVGHSLGAAAALHAVQSSGKTVSELILVAPVNPGQDWAGLKQKSNSDWDACKRFAEIQFDWDKITRLANQVIVYYSDNDNYIPMESVAYYKKALPHAVFKFRPGAGHFNARAGMLEFPELLQDILTSSETDAKV